MASGGAVAGGVVNGHHQRKRIPRSLGVNRMNENLIDLAKGVNVVAAEVGNRPFGANGRVAQEGEVGLLVEWRFSRAVDLDGQQRGWGGRRRLHAGGLELHQSEDAGDERGQQRRRRADGGNDNLGIHFAVGVAEDVFHGPLSSPLAGHIQDGVGAKYRVGHEPRQRSAELVG